MFGELLQNKSYITLQNHSWFHIKSRILHMIAGI